MRAAAADSWELLTPGEQTVGQMLAVALVRWLDLAPDQEAEARRLEYLRGVPSRWTVDALLEHERV